MDPWLKQNEEYQSANKEYSTHYCEILPRHGRGKIPLVSMWFTCEKTS